MKATPSRGRPTSSRSTHGLLSELSTTARLPTGTSAHVRAREIRVVLGGRPVLSDVNVTVSHRSRMAVVGENGRGKTTLLRVLAGDLAPDDGAVERVGTSGVVHQSLRAHAGETVGTLVAESVRLPHLALRALDLAAAGLERGDAGADDLYATALDAATRLDAWDAEQEYEAQQAEHARLTQAAQEARNRLTTGWRPDKGTGKHQRQSHAPGVVQGLRRRQEVLEAHRVSVPQPPRSLRWPQLRTRRGMPILRCDDVTVEGRLRALISWDLDGGDRLLVTGPNGAGKSTLLGVLAGHITPSTGAVRRSSGTTIAYLPEEVPPWPVDLHAHEVYRRHTAKLVTQGEVAEADLLPLGSTGLLDREALRTPVGRMSQGQQRRLHLALCLAERPDLLILDEPTNHLSSLLVDELTDALRTTPAAVVVATHDRQMLSDLASWPSMTVSPATGGDDSWPPGS